MTWLERHRRSEQAAAAAEEAARNGELVRARDLYRVAGVEERAALDAVPKDKARTAGITAVSAVALFYKGAALDEAERLALRCLGELSTGPSFARQLRDLLQAIWTDRALATSYGGFTQDRVRVSVRGGPVVHGGAPLDLVMSRLETIKSLLFRTTERMLKMPLRRRGGPEEQVKSSCDPWVFQTAPGSYRFEVGVRRAQDVLPFPDAAPPPDAIAREFLTVLKASVESPTEEFPRLVPEVEYRTTILKLTETLAPPEESSLRVAIGGASLARDVHLTGQTRAFLREEQKAQRRLQLPRTGEPGRIEGILRAVHLDEDWLEVTVADGQHVKVVGVTESVDDVLGPLVNKHVVVEVIRRSELRHPRFEDISPAE